MCETTLGLVHLDTVSLERDSGLAERAEVPRLTRRNANLDAPG
jgi:hypothetical protein